MNLLRLPTMVNAEKDLAEAQEAVRRACHRVDAGVVGAEEELNAAYDMVTRASAAISKAKRSPARR